ncbi:glutathione S-transferase family protein [Pseudomonas sp. ICMP22404]|uniref:glutathione S-transferase family protein n=1 Tax=Pseudomonas sp. ICMP22404 TaxID=2583807 RepID=UPI00111B1E42|nr:glutathione S-transferase family protein [Pseudomonas sp. ICMP22404]TNF83372.1 glutathione S-transferase family protein [Pseudomonas sp. ICMP22404]
MITIYQFESSPLCEKVRRILGYKGIEYQIHEVDRSKAQELKHVSPFGKFPAIDDDGVSVCDSTDIAYYLDNKFAQRPLIPADPILAAQMHIIEDWADESLYFYEITMRLSWEHNARHTIKAIMSTLPKHLTEEQALALVLAGSQQLVAAQGLGRKTQQQVVADVQRHLKAIAALLKQSKWLVGDSISLADIAVLSQLNCLLYAREVVDAIKQYPDIVSWAERVDRVAPAKP